jgi:hypothetical protein
MYDETNPITLSKISFAFGPHQPKVRSSWKHHNIIAGICRSNIVRVQKRTKCKEYRVSIWRRIQHLELTRKEFEALSYKRFGQLEGESIYPALMYLTMDGVGEFGSDDNASGFANLEKAARNHVITRVSVGEDA